VINWSISISCQNSRLPCVIKFNFSRLVNSIEALGKHRRMSSRFSVDSRCVSRDWPTRNPLVSSAIQPIYPTAFLYKGAWARAVAYCACFEWATWYWHYPRCLFKYVKFTVYCIIPSLLLKLQFSFTHGWRGFQSNVTERTCKIYWNNQTLLPEGWYRGKMYTRRSALGLR
jgi:hypothetical protein